MQIIRVSLVMSIAFFIVNMAQPEPITIKTRSQVVTATNGGKYESMEKEATWELSLIHI